MGMISTRRWKRIECDYCGESLTFSESAQATLGAAYEQAIRCGWTLSGGGASDGCPRTTVCRQTLCLMKFARDTASALEYER